MKYDLPYLSGLDLQEPSDKAHLLALKLAKIPGDRIEYLNQVLDAMQDQGYTIQNVQLAGPAQEAPVMAYILYR